MSNETVMELSTENEEHNQISEQSQKQSQEQIQDEKQEQNQEQDGRYHKHEHGTIESDPIKPFLSRHIPGANNVKTGKDSYCYRHNPEFKCNKEADEDRMIQIQKQLEKLSKNDQKVISNVWSVFSAAPGDQRVLILNGILTQCCFPQLSYISSQIKDLIKIDFLNALPMEISLKILCYLDCESLCNAAQVSRSWKRLADDDRVWHHMCEQHIDRKCPNCGWGLPLMLMKRNTAGHKQQQSQDQNVSIVPQKRSHDDSESYSSSRKKTRSWKAVYSERFKVERNWRKGFYRLREFKGHTDGILCLKFNHRILVTGSFDSTIKIWDINTGKLLNTLRGHKAGVRSLVFDDKKLISGGLDSTIKVWNLKTGEYLSTYRGHQKAIMSVDAFEKIIVSGSADRTIKVWNVENRTCHSLRGHKDCVNYVKIHPQSMTLVSCSDDGEIRLWCLKTNVCLRVFGANHSLIDHVGQVQCAIPIIYKDTMICDKFDKDSDEAKNEEDIMRRNEGLEDDELSVLLKQNDSKLLPTHILSSALDNQIKVWDVKTGKCVRTQFGHIEGVWSIAVDSFRVVSGAHDKLVKVWDLQDGKCLHTFAGHKSAVSCVDLSDSRFVSGDDSGMVRMYCFDD